MKPTYQVPKEELLRKTNRENGLSFEKAEAIRADVGENVLSESKPKSVLRVFFEQFADFLVIILLVAAVVSMVSGNLESTLVIVAVILLNAVLGTLQYVKAQKSLESLKALSSPHATVLRDGAKHRIPSKDVVPGDILFLEAGDMIVADGRILDNASLQVNESALTGESVNVDKRDVDFDTELPLADRVNTVYAGTLVTYGRAVVLVTDTGMQTEMGRIAALMNATKEKKTPLQVSLDAFSKKLAFAIMVVCLAVLALRLWQGEAPLDSLMFAVALAVAAIPEALGSIVTIVQAMGTRKMATDHAIMKDLKAVESLGCVTVICSDKTGTLTQNNMTATAVYVGGESVPSERFTPNSDAAHHLLLGAVLNNDATLGSDKAIGDPTESCLLTLAQNVGIDVEELRRRVVRIGEVPFDSDRKLMSSQYTIGRHTLVYTKGALDVLLARCDKIADGNIVRELDDQDRAAVLRQNEVFSENGLRVLAFAYKVDATPLTKETENGYTFIGLVSMVDPPRAESVGAVADAIAAGIKPVMITGDHPVTAKAIASQIGICQVGDRVVTGQQLDAMSDEELDGSLEQIAVYARVSPENKIRIVDAWQRKGYIVAMTGDGVNDAPALKKADIGIAMGITGTEVSKDAASMILSDDNFATIIKAVEGGRNVYRNILNAIRFLLSGNLAAILVVLVCTVAALATPFEAVHLLFINLLTDSLPALAIGMEPSDHTLLKQKPRSVNEGIFTKSFGLQLLGYGVLIAAVTMTAYLIGYQIDPATASTMAFATLTLSRLFHGFTCRSDRSLVSIGLLSNPWSIGAFAAGVLLLAAVLFLPFLHGLFSVVPLTVSQVGSIVLLAVLPTVLVQGVRIAKKGRSRS